MGLAVIVDGSPMPEPDARAFWERFSAWMEEHRGDLAGFAAKEGFASVHPGVDNGRPVLHASKSKGQRPYAPVAQDPERAGGSGGRHEPGNRGSGAPRKATKSGRNRRA